MAKKELPKIMSAGPPELRDKKLKDWRKAVWRSDIHRRKASYPKFTIVVDLDADVDVSKHRPIMFEMSNNQMWPDKISYRATGHKKDLIDFLVYAMGMDQSKIGEVYSELK